MDTPTMATEVVPLVLALRMEMDDWLSMAFLAGVAALTGLGQLLKKHREKNQPKQQEDADEQVIEIDLSEVMDDQDAEPAEHSPPPLRAFTHPPPRPHRHPVSRGHPATAPTATPVGGAAGTASARAGETPAPPAPGLRRTLGEVRSVLQEALARRLEEMAAPPSDSTMEAAPAPVARPQARPRPTEPTVVPTSRPDDDQEPSPWAVPSRSSRSLAGIKVNSPAALRKAIVLAEIIGRPIALRDHPNPDRPS